jgi:hypothetical protein
VFQSYALFPHLDVYEYVAFGLRRRGGKDVTKQVEDALELVELAPMARGKPARVSGGQQQRVAGASGDEEAKRAAARVLQHESTLRGCRGNFVAETSKQKGLAGVPRPAEEGVRRFAASLESASVAPPDRGLASGAAGDGNMAGLTKGRAVCAALALVLSAAWLSPRALAQGATDYPIPSSAKEAYSPIGEGFEVPIEPRADLRGPKPYVDDREERLREVRRQRMPDAPAFFRDTELHANSRTYEFAEDQFGFNRAEAFTTGGSIAYQSGYLADVFQLRSSNISTGRSSTIRSFPATTSTNSGRS